MANKKIDSLKIKDDLYDITLSSDAKINVKSVTASTVTCDSLNAPLATTEWAISAEGKVDAGLLLVKGDTTSYNTTNYNQLYVQQGINSPACVYSPKVFLTTSNYVIPMASEKEELKDTVRLSKVAKTGQYADLMNAPQIRFTGTKSYGPFEKTNFTSVAALNGLRDDLNQYSPSNLTSDQILGTYYMIRGYETKERGALCVSNGAGLNHLDSTAPGMYLATSGDSGYWGASYLNLSFFAPRGLYSILYAQNMKDIYVTAYIVYLG